MKILLGYRGTLPRAAIAALLSSEDDFEVVGELERTDGLLDVALEARPNVAVLDYTLPGSVEVSNLCLQLRRALPGCGVLALLDRRSLDRGARTLVRLAPQVGLMGTDTTPKDLVDGLRRLAQGKPVLDVDLAVAALRSWDTVLTDREREVLELTALGATAKEIGTSLCLSTGTVRNYLSRILTKLGARTRIEAVRIAQEAAWI
jgi:two-component system, NarL family, response regulator DesR